jgi:hypothetical protein
MGNRDSRHASRDKNHRPLQVYTVSKLYTLWVTNAFWPFSHSVDEPEEGRAPRKLQTIAQGGRMQELNPLSIRISNYLILSKKREM